MDNIYAASSGWEDVGSVTLKKSFGATAPLVATPIRSIAARSGIRCPVLYRCTTCRDVPICSAKSPSDNP